MRHPLARPARPVRAPRASAAALVVLGLACTSSPTPPGVPAGSPQAGPSGSFAWRATGFRGASRPAVDDAAVYVVGRDHMVRAFDRATGVPRWSSRLGVPSGALTRDAVVESGVLVVGADYLFGLDAATGAVRWRFAPTGAASVGGAYLLAAGAGAVFAGSSGGPGVVYAVDARTGAARWTAALPLHVGPRESVSVFDPVLAHGRVYVSYTHFPRDSTGRALDSRGGAAAFDASDGTLRWHRAHPSPGGLPTSAKTGVAADGSTVLATAADAAVYALEPGTGQPRWTVPPLPNLPNTDLDHRPTALRGDLAAVGNWRGVVTAYRASDGVELWRRAAWPASVLNVAADDANVYVTYASGQLAAQAVVDGSTRWVFERAESYFYPPRLGDGVLYASGAEGLAAIRTR